jgi:hypothetical protein
VRTTLLQAYDATGRTFMKYEVLHGAFHDVPAKFLMRRNGAHVSEVPKARAPARLAAGTRSPRAGVSGPAMSYALATNPVT